MTNKQLTEDQKWNSYKIDIDTLKKANALSDIKFSDDYFDIMHNEWLLDKYIAKFDIAALENHNYDYNAVLEQLISQGYAISLVAQAMKDDTILCFKHKALGELTGLNAYVTNLKYEDICNLTVKNTKQHIPTLQEVLNIIAGRTPVVIEICNEAYAGRVETAVEKILEEYCNAFEAIGKVAIMSANPMSLMWFYDNAPWYTRILRSCAFNGYKTYANIKAKKLKKLKYLKASQADFVAYNAKDLPTKYIKKNKVVGILAYNVYSQEEYKRILPYSDNIVFAHFTPEL